MANIGITANPPIFEFHNTYAQLPEAFYRWTQPDPVPSATLVVLNDELIEKFHLNREQLAGSDDGLAILAGNIVPVGAKPLAMAYAGHQFGGFVPQLGDGRAVLLGELRDTDGRLYDMQLKGSGRTFYSRSGDGRMPLGPALREYLMCEAMHQLGIPTTLALSVVRNTLRLQRHTGEESGAVLTRIARSHIRIGTFQYFAYRQDIKNVLTLANYLINRAYSELESQTYPYSGLLNAICRRQARLVASWMSVGFVHGVLNTDNVALSGETIDYGPCAFLDTYKPDAKFSFIDTNGRYAYDQQSKIMRWNLEQLGKALEPLLSYRTLTSKAAPVSPNNETAVAEALAYFDSCYTLYYRKKFQAKLGLGNATCPGDDALISDFLALLAQQKVDFTLGFRELSKAIESNEPLEPLFGCFKGIGAWLTRWRARLTKEGCKPDIIQAQMDRVNPLYITRSHLITQSLKAAEAGDYAPYRTLMTVLQHPFEEQSGRSQFALPPPTDVSVVTFCGT